MRCEKTAQLGLGEVLSIGKERIISVGGLAQKFEAKLSHYKQLDVPLIRRDTRSELM